MSLVSRKSKSCPFCNLGFLSHANLLRHVASCSDKDMQNRMEALTSDNFEQGRVIYSLKNIASVMTFVHEFENVVPPNQKNMYVCTDCYAHGFGPLNPDECLTCGGKNIVSAEQYIQELLVDE